MSTGGGLIGNSFAGGTFIVEHSEACNCDREAQNLS